MKVTAAVDAAQPGLDSGELSKKRTVSPALLLKVKSKRGVKVPLRIKAHETLCLCSSDGVKVRQ